MQQNFELYGWSCVGRPYPINCYYFAPHAGGKERSGSLAWLGRDAKRASDVQQKTNPAPSKSWMGESDEEQWDCMYSMYDQDVDVNEEVDWISDIYIKCHDHKYDNCFPRYACKKTNAHISHITSYHTSIIFGR